MNNILSDTIQISILSYPCDACGLWVNSGYGKDDVPADDWLIIEAARADNWKIRKKTKYRKVISIDNGQFATYRARLDMDSLCQRLDLYED